jgi:folylpolyglutamate synthase/dihydropteroate synthase
MDAELGKAIEYSQRLLDAAIAVVGASHVELNESWARDPKVVALTILCRSISNFRAAVRLVQQQQVLEARAIVRMLNENLLWIGALRERGSAFVQEMIADDAHNRKALAELTLKMTGKHGGDVNAEGAQTASRPNQ